VTPSLLLLLAGCILAVAILYSSIGHGGASGYIAVLAMFSVAPAAFKPTALVLNILVSAVATFHFARAGHFSWRLFWPFAATSVPLSFVGGYLTVPASIYNPLLGIVLLASAVRLFSREDTGRPGSGPPPTTVALGIGAALGFLSGLIGVGGGIFLSPLMLLMDWGSAKEASAVAALFILVNSIAGLLGHVGGLQAIPSFVPILAATALCGGIIGSFFGSFRLQGVSIVRILSVVLTIGGAKLLLA
jgi:uncharacterized membrane protein YfcA